MRDPKRFTHTASVVNVLSRAAGPLLPESCAVIIKLKRDADDIIAGILRQGRGDRRIDPARHRNNHPCAGTIGAKTEVQISAGKVYALETREIAKASLGNPIIGWNGWG